MGEDSIEMFKGIVVDCGGRQFTVFRPGSTELPESREPRDATSPFKCGMKSAQACASLRASRVRKPWITLQMDFEIKHCSEIGYIEMEKIHEGRASHGQFNVCFPITMGLRRMLQYSPCCGVHYSSQ